MRSGEDTTSVLAGFTITRGKGTYDLEDYPMGLGGGIFIHGSGGKIIHNIIENNVMGTSTDYTTLPLIYNGGGIYADVFNNHTLIVRENMIRNNQCIGDDGNGAGAFLTGGRIIFDKNSVMDNRLEMMGAPMGAGLFWQFIEYKGNIDEYIFTNNIIAGNFMEGVGGGLFLNNAGAVVCSNSVINNEATEDGNSLSIYKEMLWNELLLYNNIIWSSVDNGKSDIDLWGNLSTQFNLLKDTIQQDDSTAVIGNIYLVPVFSGSSYELSESSPAIGGGADSVLCEGIWYYTPSKDIFGNSRPDPVDPYIDLGAIESPYARSGSSGGETINIEDHRLSVYPNPANAGLFIRTTGSSIGIMEIASSNGQIIERLSVEEPDYRLDLSSFHNGVYFITIRSEDFVTIRKIIKL